MGKVIGTLWLTGCRETIKVKEEKRVRYLNLERGVVKLWALSRDSIICKHI